MEKRWYSRSPKRVMVRYSKGTSTHTVFTQDVSRTGLYVETDRVFERGTLVRIEVHGQERKLSFHGRVMWVRRASSRLAGLVGTGMGIRCIDAGEDWQRFVRSCQAERVSFGVPQFFTSRQTSSS